MESASQWLRVGTVEEVANKRVVVVQGADRPISIWADGREVFSAVDNRCPHLGFPLHKGTLKEGVLTCQWHQARFDVCSGCTFDTWADDVPAYETKVENGAVWVSAMPRVKADRAFHLKRLEKGMRQNVALLQAKAVVGLLHVGVSAGEILREIARFAARELNVATGLTELAITGNLLPVLSEETAYFLLLRSARVIATAAAGSKRVELDPLEGKHTGGTLRRWFRQWVAAREKDGAERVLRAGIDKALASTGDGGKTGVAEMEFAAVSDQVFRSQGHAFDFANKKMELLDIVGWEAAGDILPLGLDSLLAARGVEESAAWHEPVEILRPLAEAERELEGMESSWRDREVNAEGRLPALEVLLGNDPLAILRAVKEALAGRSAVEVSWQVAYAAGMRLAQFANSNEVGDWFNPQHTFTYANAVHQAVKRCPTASVVRSVFHAAMSVYMDRFLNVPPAKLPGETAASREAMEGMSRDPAALLKEVLDLLDRQGSGDRAAMVVVRYLRLGGKIGPLTDMLALATVREDLDFHTLQVLEAGYQLARSVEGRAEAEHLFVAIVRDLAAFCPTRRAQLKTAMTALKLDRGDHVYEE
jgi:nitrite reductase/ring-hydroxylating ferredoxin subunit